MAAKLSTCALLRPWTIAIAFAFFVCPVSGQEIAKPTTITIEYWHAFKGECTHVIQFQAGGTYTTGTTSSDSRQKIKTWKSAESSFTAKHLEPLLAFCNTPEVRRAFAKTKLQSIPDGDALMVRISQNKYSLQFDTQPCLADTNTAPERKLVAIVTELLRKADLHLYEPPNWQDVLIGRENIDTVGLDGLLLVLRQLHDAEGRTVPLKLYFLGKPDEKKQIIIPAEYRKVKDILHDIGVLLGLGFSTYRDIAVFGTPEELHRFDRAMAGQPPPSAASAYIHIPIMVMLAARLDEMTDFMNQKLGEQNFNWRLECLSHGDHSIYCTGNDIPVMDIISVVAADLVEPVSKVFAEKRIP